ncbi:MAG: hypothetical protein ACOCVF_00665 [bacterium]
MNILLIVLVVILLIIVLLLSIALFYFIKKSIYLSDKEKEFIIFTFDVYENYADDLGIQSKEEHEKLRQELIRIRKKHLS